jgi:hypothetical protein
VGSQRFSASCRSAILVGASLAGVLGTASSVMAQALKDLQTPDTPLVLKAQGSFYVGGEKSEQTQVQLGGLGPGGHITVNQMYLLNPSATKGLVLVEPGRCPDTYTDQQIATLATMPILVVFGDHRDTPTGISTRPSWQLSFESCQALIDRLKAAGGDAEILNPKDRGIRGNSHMIMQDKNHLQIADLILQWIDVHVSKRSAGKK